MGFRIRSSARGPSRDRGWHLRHRETEACVHSGLAMELLQGTAAQAGVGQVGAAAASGAERSTAQHHHLGGTMS